MPTKGNVIAAIALLCSTSAMAGNTAGFEMGGRYARFDPVVSQYDLQAATKRALLANELYLIVTVIFSEMSGGLNG
jgi:hypothetical protein